MKSRNLFAALIVLLMPVTMEARPEYLDLFRATYPTSSVIATCALCHIDPAGGGPRNSYGTAFENTGRNALAFRVIENLDSDGDTFSNIAEITALTFPGNALSFPGSGSGTPSITSWLGTWFEMEMEQTVKDTPDKEGYLKIEQWHSPGHNIGQPSHFHVSLFIRNGDGTYSKTGFVIYPTFVPTITPEGFLGWFNLSGQFEFAFALQGQLTPTGVVVDANLRAVGIFHVNDDSDDDTIEEFPKWKGAWVSVSGVPVSIR